MAEHDSTLPADRRNLADLWAEMKAAEAELNAAGDIGPEDDPAWTRWRQARDAIRLARPTDAAGLAVQLQLLHELLCDSDPTAAELAMLEHIVAAVALLGEGRS
jgi:hypothetical protein